MLQRSVLLLVAILCYPGRGIEKPEPKAYDVPQAYAVYEAVLAQETLHTKFLIAETTIPFTQCLDSHSDKRVNSAISAYREINQTVWHLHSFSRNHRLVSQQEIDKLRKPDPRGGFAWRFPGDIEVAHLSAVGFSPDGNIAFVETDLQCGGLCGSGGPHILQKRNGKWRTYDASVSQNADGTFSFDGSCGWYY